jgi:hypothetical protein
VSVQEEGGTKGGTLRALDYNFFNGKRKRKSLIGSGFFVHHTILTAVMKVRFVSDRMSYMVLIGLW